MAVCGICQNYSSIQELGTAWRKGLRRLLCLPYRTHNVMLAPLRSMLPLGYELMCHCVKFINNCLISCNDVVSFVARHGTFFQQMFSPIGCNAQRCCETVGLSLSNLHSFKNKLVFQVVYSSLPDWVMPAVSIVLELIQTRNRRSLQLLSSCALRQSGNFAKVGLALTMSPWPMFIHGGAAHALTAATIGYGPVNRRASAVAI